MRSLTTFQIKIIAICTMAIDHIGFYILYDSVPLRIVGRLAFPLFAWLIANGAYYTKNINKYLLRLFVFAVISQIPYMLLNQSTTLYKLPLNALFTLGLGLSAIIFLKQNKNIYLQVLVVAIYALLANILNMDYGAAGVLSVVAFYAFFKNLKLMILSQSIIYVIVFRFSTLPINQFSSFSSLIPTIEPFGLLSLLIIALYSFKEGKKMKYFFYWFYPLHLLAIYLIYALVAK